MTFCKISSSRGGVNPNPLRTPLHEVTACFIIVGLVTNVNLHSQAK